MKMTTQSISCLMPGLTVLTALILAAGCSPQSEEKSDSPVPVMEPAPEKSAVSEAGKAAAAEPESEPDSAPQVDVIKESELSGLLKAGDGKITVVNLWATWCPPCVMELPHMSEFYRKTSRDKVHFVALSFDSPESVNSAVKSFLKQKKVPFPVHVMGGRDIDAISTALKTELSGAIPTTLIYDSAGNLKIKQEGAVTREWLDNQLSTLS